MADPLKVKRKQKLEEFREREEQRRREAFHYVRLITKVCDEFILESPPFKQCSRCGKIISKGYHYQKSSRGEIWLCAACNHKVRHPKGIKPKIIYNAVETNKRTH